jgi:glycosyltransferase involved in cell wall biosynthesis
MNQLLVSVVIPCYNVEEYIEESITSVLHQTYENIEIICVDDGSSDSTVSKIIKIQRANTEKIRLIETPNHGASTARNIGFKNSRGEYIQFLDADDMLLPEKIRHQIDLIKKNGENPAVVAGNYIIRYNSGQTSIAKIDKRSPWFGLIGIRLGITSSNLWYKAVLDEVSGWNEKQKSSQEYELMFRILKTGAMIKYDDRPLTIIRKSNEQSISRTNLRENRIRNIQLKINIHSFLHQNMLLTEELKVHYHNEVFNVIRTLYKYDRAEALKYFRQLLPENFTPGNEYVKRNWYVYLYKLFGFINSQIIWDYYISFKKSIANIIKSELR